MLNLERQREEFKAVDIIRWVDEFVKVFSST